MIEIERKFLVTSFEFKNEAYAKKSIVQGYLSSNPERMVRIRTNGKDGFITIKGMGNKSGMSRFEWEKMISLEEATALLKLCEEGAIEKIRYEVKVLKADSLYIGNVKDAQINFGLSGDDTFYATSQSSSNMGALVCVTSAAYDNATLMRSLYEFILPDSIVENAIIDSAIFILNIDSWKDKRESTDETFDS